MIFTVVAGAASIYGGFFTRKPETPHQNPSTVAKAERPPTLRELFASDFSNLLKLTDPSCKIQWKNENEYGFVCQLYLDFDGKSEFVGYYLPSSTRIMDVCIRLADGVPETIEKASQRISLQGGSTNQMNTMKELTFTKRVFLYHEDFLSITQRATIIDAYKRKGLDVNFRGPDYLRDQTVAWSHRHEGAKP